MNILENNKRGNVHTEAQYHHENINVCHVVFLKSIYVRGHAKSLHISSNSKIGTINFYPQIREYPVVSEG